MLNQEYKPSPLIRVHHQGLRIYSRQGYTDEQIESFSHLVQRSSRLPISYTNNQALVGRVPLISNFVKDIGNVVVKSYRRGGLLRGILASTHTRIFETRCRLEFNILDQVRTININAPEPLAYIEEGEFFYHAWLITRQIEGGVNLIDFVNSNPNLAQLVVSKLAEQIKTLILNRFHHIDLHPGNVMVDPNLDTWIVDFDKAYHYAGDLNKLRDRYLRRWRRAVIKHQLSEVFSECISLALRERF